MNMHEVVSFLVIKDRKLLVEKRKVDRSVDPGLNTIPGGHCEPGESLEDTLSRELKEELGIVSTDNRYVCTLIQKSEEVQKIHYFVTEDWTGTLENNEAEYLFWIGLEDLNELDLEADKLAVSEYMRIY